MILVIILKKMIHYLWIPSQYNYFSYSVPLNRENERKHFASDEHLRSFEWLVFSEN